MLSKFQALRGKDYFGSRLVGWTHKQLDCFGSVQALALDLSKTGWSTKSSAEAEHPDALLSHAVVLVDVVSLAEDAPGAGSRLILCAFERPRTFVAVLGR